MQGRQARRAEFNGEVAVLRGDCELRARARNVSAGGMMLICTDGLLWDRARVTVLFHLPDDRGPIELKGAVVRHSSAVNACGWGVEFLEVSEEVAEALEAYVAERTDGPPPIPSRTTTGLDETTAGVYFDDDKHPTEVMAESRLAELRQDARQPPDAPTEGGVPRWINV